MPRLASEKKTVAATAASSRSARKILAKETTKAPETKTTATKKVSRGRKAATAGATGRVKKAGKQTKTKGGTEKKVTGGKKKTVQKASANVSRPKGAPAPELVNNGQLKSIGLEYVVEKIVQSRLDADGGREYLVKWKGWTSKDNSWEPAVHLNNAFDLITEFDQKYPDAP